MSAVVYAAGLISRRRATKAVGARSGQDFHPADEREGAMTALLPADLNRLAKLLGLLGSDHLGECDNAARAAHRLVQQYGCTWFDVVTPAPLGQALRCYWPRRCAA
jgi:hypothetical protein